jgi:TRAP-type C4-dicarboxylate transport system substrate-binding protein
MFKLKILLKTLMVLAIAFSFLPASSSQVQAQEYTMTFRTVAPEGTPWAKQLKRIKKHWEKESNGRLKVKVILGRGNEKALVRKCKAGEVQGIGVSTGAMIGVAPELGVFELPFLFKSPKEADKIIDNVLFNSIEKLLQGYGFQLYIFSENGNRNFASKGKFVKTPADLATLKMRSQENWIHMDTYRALGGNPVSLSVAEVLTGLSTGQVDGFDNTPLFAFAASWYSKIDHWTVSDHIYQPAVIVFNKDWYNSLPEDLQQLLLSDRKTETTKGRKAIRKLNKGLLKNLETKGVKMYELSNAEKATFAAKTKSVHKTFKKKKGCKKCKKILEVIEKSK